MKTYKYHYVYRITNTQTQKYYYGSRSTNEIPSYEIGHNYFSNFSEKWFQLDQKENPQNYKYKIIKIFETNRDDAILLESKLHYKFDVKNHVKFYNKSNQAPKGFDTTGKVATKSGLISVEEYRNDIYEHVNKNTLVVWDVRVCKFTTISVNEYYSNKQYYKTTTSGKAVVVDQRDCKMKLVSKDEYSMNAFYVSHQKGLIPSRNKIIGETIFLTHEEFESTDLFEHTMKNKVVVKDKETNKTKTISGDEFANTTKYENVNKGKVQVKDENGNIFQVTQEEFDKGNYDHMNKGEVSVIDIRDKIKKRVSKDDYEKYDYYVGLRSKHIEIYDENGNLIHSVYGSFEKYCKENDLPFESFKGSYQKNGKQLYAGKLRKPTIDRIIKNGNIKFKGWYALVKELSDEN